MGKRVIKLTECELRQMIYEAVLPVLNEIDADTYSRVHKATNRAKSDNQKGNYIRQINATKQKTNDDIIAQGIDLEPRAADSMITPYKDIQYMFYCHNLRQNTGIVLFTLSNLYELTSQKAILKGEIIFNNNKMNGSIIIDMLNLNVVYYHNASKKKYSLEIDNRFASKWDNLCTTLQRAAQLIS
jgi:hypothetical protein